MQNFKNNFKIAYEKANPVTLKFYNINLEDEFRIYYPDKYIFQLRLAHILAAVFFIIAAFNDLLIYAEELMYPLIRVLAVVSMFAGGLLFTFLKKNLYLRFYQWISLIYVLVTGFSFIIPGLYQEFPKNQFFYTGVIICLIFNYTFIKQDFIKASAAGLILVISFLILSNIYNPVFLYLLHVSTYIIICNLLGMFIAYTMEYDGRKTFLLDKKIREDKASIENINKNLEVIVSKRTAALQKNEMALKDSIKDLKDTLENIIQTLVKIVEIRDLYTSGHQKNVSILATAIAKKMNVDNNILKDIRIAALLHDIGKINIPSSILVKPGKLSDIELTMIREHPLKGYEILKNIKFSPYLLKTVLQHHEREDGSGYPDGLKGTDIIPGAKILAVSDVVEAMSSFRPYRPALDISEALAEIANNKGILYDPSVVDCCLELFKKDNFKIPGDQTL